MSEGHRLLIHPSHLLTSRQPLAHDRDDVAVGRRRLLKRPAGQQRRALAHLRPGHDRLGPGAIAAGCLAVSAYQDRERSSTVEKGPVVAPQNEQRPAASVTGAGTYWPVVAGG
jgi:hypothetical protein